MPFPDNRSGDGYIKKERSRARTRSYYDYFEVGKRDCGVLNS
ncbi:hypothetical protein [Tychonema sp. LEGE 07203]|nr:hypothetical protein [Tychonema sp. LEGE 07203]